MRAFLALALAAFGLIPSVARACGVSSPGAAAGVCDASEVLDAKVANARTHRVGLSASYTSTALFLSDGSRVDMQRQAVVASLSFRVDKVTTLELGAGSLVGGTLGGLGLRPGGLGSLSASWRIVEQHQEGRPFVLLTGVAAFLIGSTSDGKLLTAIDFRGGLLVGTTVGRPQRATITPYLAAQVFGGPVFWTHNDSTVLGTDVHKYGIGGGVAGSIGRVGLFAGGSMIGDQSLTFGASMSF